MNEMKQLQMRLTCNNELVYETNPTIIFCDGLQPSKDESILSFLPEDIVYASDYKDRSKQYGLGIEVIQRVPCCAVVVSDPIVFNKLTLYAWNGINFDCYLYNTKVVLEEGRLKLSHVCTNFSELTNNELRHTHKLGIMLVQKRRN